jgi:signal transduction histidine kinase
MLELDVRTTILSAAGLSLALGAARFLSRRAYRDVPGYWLWLASDVLIGLSLGSVGFRYTLLSERASIVGASVLSVAGFELRYFGVLQFLGLPRVSRLSLLPDGTALGVLLALVLLGAPQGTQNPRVVVLFGLLAFISLRTARPLLRSHAGRLTRDARVLGVVGVLAAASLAAVAIWVAAHPLTADWTTPQSSPVALFYVFSNLLVAAWSLLSFALMAAWVELRREEIIAVVSHDLKAPVMSILLRAEALLRRRGDPSFIDRTAKSIRQSASTMDQLIHDLLDMESLDAGHLRLDLAPTDIAEVIGSVVDTVAPLASRRSTRIVCEMAPLGSVRCDKDRVARVVANLVGNAIKFTERGTITIHAEERPDDVLVSVADTGCGIARDVLPHVFDRYFTTARGQTGAGLGLYIARGIVAAHGGRLWATSDPGKGSTFSFTLPRSASRVTGTYVEALRSALRTRG